MFVTNRNYCLYPSVSLIVLSMNATTTKSFSVVLCGVLKGMYNFRKQRTRHNFEKRVKILLASITTLHLEIFHPIMRTPDSNERTQVSDLKKTCSNYNMEGWTRRSGTTFVNIFIRRQKVCNSAGKLHLRNISKFFFLLPCFGASPLL